jgi:hypothetical protein
MKVSGSLRNSLGPKGLGLIIYKEGKDRGIIVKASEKEKKELKALKNLFSRSSDEEKDFETLTIEKLEKIFTKTINDNLNEIIPSTMSEYLQMKFVVSPAFYSRLGSGILDN